MALHLAKQFLIACNNWLDSHLSHFLFFFARARVETLVLLALLFVACNHQGENSARWKSLKQRSQERDRQSYALASEYMKHLSVEDKDFLNSLPDGDARTTYTLALGHLENATREHAQRYFKMRAAGATHEQLKKLREDGSKWLDNVKGFRDLMYSGLAVQGFTLSQNTPRFLAIDADGLFGTVASAQRKELQKEQPFTLKRESVRRILTMAYQLHEHNDDATISEVGLSAFGILDIYFQALVTEFSDSELKDLGYDPDSLRTLVSNMELRFELIRDRWRTGQSAGHL